MLFDVGLDHAIVRNPDTGHFNVLKWSHTRWIILEEQPDFSSAYARAMKLDLECNGGVDFD